MDWLGAETSYEDSLIKRSRGEASLGLNLPRLVMASRMLDPRTATGHMSIWEPLGELRFQQNISALWKTTRGRPKTPQTYSVATQTIYDEVGLSITLELQLANGIAFIAASRKGVESVSAAVIEMPRNPSDGLKLNLAANEGISQTVKDCMDKIGASVRNVARGGKPTTLS